MTKRIIDEAARQEILFDLNTNFVVEAGAGSGKTASLVNRMVNLIRTGTCTIEEIVAITFTRKAADELKLRFQLELEAAWSEALEEEVKNRVGTALQNFELCFLGTVHSFCAKLLRARPIEAGLDLNFTELEEREDLELLEEAWQMYLQAIQNEKPAVLREMNELGIKVEDLFSNLRKMKDYPDVEWVSESIEKPDFSNAFRSLMNIIKEAERLLPVQTPNKGYDKLQLAIIAALKKERHMFASRNQVILEIFEMFSKQIKPTYNRWEKEQKEDVIYYYGKIISLVEGTIQPLLKSWKEYRHPIIKTFLRGALHRYEQLKKERSLLNFQDLLIQTALLLKENPEIRSYFQAKYTRILVDEYQDTDPIQAEIMFYLTSENINEQIWIRCRPKPGALFVVGDPKQAIYRFRRADIDTYNRVKELIVEHGGRVLQLTMNFRTLDTITEKLNQVFSTLLPEKESVYQAAYRPLHSYHQDDNLKFSGIHQLPVPSEFTRKDDIIIKDAENIASFIYSALQTGSKPSEFMVLTRYNDGVATYAEQIENKGIPVSVSGEFVIGEMVEFKDLEILLHAFIDPTDELAFVAALRGIFFGISDDELYKWKRSGGRFSIYSDVTDADRLEETSKTRFETVLVKMKQYHKWVRNLSPTIAIEKIIEDVGFFPLLLTNNRGKRAYKGLLQIIEALRKYEGEGHSTYKQVVELLNERVNEKTVVATLEGEADAVRVMNVHKAKGLEAPIVILAHPAKKVEPESFLNKHIKREDFASKGFFSFSVKKGFHTKELAIPPEWAMAKEEELRYLLEEETRIIYVAATRAERALVISTSANKNNPWEALLSIEGLQEIELTEEGQPQPSEDYKTNTISTQDYEAKTGSNYDWLEASKQYSYMKWSPTENKDYTKVLHIEREIGGGKEWGNLIHNVLEKVVKDVNVSHYIRNQLVKSKQSAEREQEVWEDIQALKESTIWTELQTAQHILTEVPFIMEVKPGERLYSLIEKAVKEDGIPIIVKGIIDLIYKTEQGWKIVDYKTDRPKNEKDLVLLEDFYQPQIQFYKNAWEYLTNEKVVDVKLFFMQRAK